MTFSKTPVLCKITAALALATAAPLAMAVAAPTSVTPSAINANEIVVDVTMTPDSDETGVLCQTSPDGTSNWTTQTCSVTTGTIGTSNSLQVTITGLTDDTLYYVQIATTDGSTPSAYTTNATNGARPNAASPVLPATPGNLGYTSPAAGSATVTWDAAASWGYGGALNATTGTDGGYEYECQETGTAFTGTPTGTTAAGTTTAAITGWDAAKTYHCQVRAVGTGSGTSVWSNGLGGIAPIGPQAIGNGAVDVPTMGEWGVMILSLLLAGSAVLVGRRRMF